MPHETQMDALIKLGTEQNDKLADIHTALEALIVAQTKTTEAVTALEPVLETVVHALLPTLPTPPSP